MLCLILILVCLANSAISENATLVPTVVDVLENSSVVLTCIFNTQQTVKTSEWTNKKGSEILTYLMDDGKCTATGFLLNQSLYKSHCYSNGTFEVNITKVEARQHGQQWQCLTGGFIAISNIVIIKVQVPVKYTNLTSPENNTIKLPERMFQLFKCKTSSGRPKPSIQWCLQVNNTVDILNSTTRDDMDENDQNLQAAESKLNISFNRYQNGAKLFCKGNSLGIEEESRKILLNVTYAPDGGPQINGISNGSTYIFRENVTGILSCSISWGNPTPLLSWNCSGNTFDRTVTNKVVQLDLEWETKRDKENICACQSTHTIAGIQTSLVMVNISYPPTIDLLMLKYNADQQDVQIQVMNNTIRVIENKTFSLICFATSKPEPFYSWIGKKTSNTSKVTIENVTTQQSYNVTCQAMNHMVFSNGETEPGQISRTVSVDVLYPPGIGHMNNITAIEGSNVTFSCPVKYGNPIETIIRWTRELDESHWSKKIFTIENVSRDDSMTYTCLVSNTMTMTGNTVMEGTKNRNIYLDVMYPPSTPDILLLLINKTEVNLSVKEHVSIAENIPFTLRCGASSRPSPALYSWTWIGMSDTSTLQLSGFSRYDKKDVTCHVSNIMTPTDGHQQIGKNNKTLSINVLYPPNIGTLNDTSAVEGSKFTLLCPIQRGNPEHTTVTWTREHNVEIWSGQELVLQNVSRKDSMVYTCTVKNKMIMTGGIVKEGLQSKTTYLNVMYKATVINYYIADYNASDTVTVAENQSIHLVCEVEGNPVPTGGIYNQNQIDIEQFVNISQKYVRFTSFFEAKCQHRGVYVCYGINEHNKPGYSEKNITLYVTCSPRPDASVPLTEIIETEDRVNVSISFKATAYPHPTNAVWKKFIMPSWTTIKTSNNIEIYQQGLEFGLTILDVSKSDFGQYKLLLNNTAGFYEQIFSVKPKVLLSEPNEPRTLNTTAIVIGIVCALAVLALTATIITVIYRCRKRNGTVPGKLIYQNVTYNEQRFKMKTKTKAEILHNEEILTDDDLQELDDVPQFANEPVEYSNSIEIIERIDRIKVAELYSYVSEKSEDSFGVDYQNLPTGLQKPCTFARKPENIALNRYNGIYPYDHSRVKLQGYPDFFINACYIDGYKRSNAYIASLGPTAKTTDDFRNFWKMIWHERSDVIVMLTNLLEPSGMKCEQYWPKEGGTMFYGDICVSSQKTEVFAEYTVRTFCVFKDEERRNLTHLHYTAWPDKKVPEDATSILEFRQRMKTTYTSSEGPIVVHCSAGIGRTGTLIALDRLIEEGQDLGSVNVSECVNNMREQRVKMVQTLEQYVYIYRTLVNALTFDYGTISVENVQEFVAETNSNVYSRQFQQLKQTVEKDSKSHAVNERQTHKLRQGADMPDDRFRVKLHLSRAENDSEFINAVYLNSFKKRDYFITAQTPLPNTVADFICMVYQEECTCIVTMEHSFEPELMIGEYLPKENNVLSFGQFAVSCSRLETKHQYVVRKMKIKYSGKFHSGEKVVYHFEYTRWMPENEAPANAGEFVQFVNDVEEYASELGDDVSHVLVHCLRANERCGLFCAVKILMEKIKFERHVSVLSTLRHLRTRRRSAITSMEQLRFCYQAVSAFIKMYRL